MLICAFVTEPEVTTIDDSGGKLLFIGAEA